jgi:hypothetical protein
MGELASRPSFMRKKIVTTALTAMLVMAAAALQRFQ